MALEPPVLIPPEGLMLDRTDSGSRVAVDDCRLVAHNVAPDGKANPIESDDPHFLYLYQFGDAFFLVRGLNPEMMSGEQISPSEADRLLALLPYRAP